LGLSNEQIQALLNPAKKQRTRRSLEDRTQTLIHSRPKQFGPLRYTDTTMRCAARGCSSPTFIKINGIPYCTTHGLYVLNKELIDNKINLGECNCNSGKYSFGHVHTEGCPVYSYIEEEK